ncbi:MAG: tRNA glutamyl-Q(34) synthetase GluQRS [Gammaproteobacteria bacterium]|nr:tRNA glutamyl-Q(34) synthetase GluQRS [Gammaproteobacteria bacterium]
MAAGRFAPSPTGPLHIGSLYTALASFLDAHAEGLAWRLRFDDLDAPRNQPGAESRILRSLEVHGLQWDGPVERQSERLDLYQGALEALRRKAKTFHCTCSRKALAGSPIYSGHCRDQIAPIPNAAIRVRVDDTALEFTDLVQGHQRTRLDLTVGDFIIKRRDGPFAYQLATAVDDGDPSIVQVLRGQDLLAHTPRQLHIMALLGLPAPTYAHIPVLLNRAGQKWSKQTGAPAVNDQRPLANLRVCLTLLGLQPPDLDLEPLVEWAKLHWRLSRFSNQNQRFDPPAS